MKAIKDCLKTLEQESLKKLMTSPAVTIFDDMIYGIGNDWKESLQDACAHLREEGYSLADVKDCISTYGATTALIEDVEEYGSDTEYVIKGVMAYSKREVDYVN